MSELLIPSAWGINWQREGMGVGKGICLGGVSLEANPERIIKKSSQEEPVRGGDTGRGTQGSTHQGSVDSISLFVCCMWELLVAGCPLGGVHQAGIQESGQKSELTETSRGCVTPW